MLSFCDDCSVGGSDAREGIKAVYSGCFDAPRHYSAGPVEDRVYLRAWHDLLHAGQAYSAVEWHKAGADAHSVLG